MGGEKSESVAVSDTEGAKPQEEEPEAVPCYICKVLLNGPDQGGEHGRQHAPPPRKSLLRPRARLFLITMSCSGAMEPDYSDGESPPLRPAPTRRRTPGFGINPYPSESEQTSPTVSFSVCKTVPSPVAQSPQPAPPRTTGLADGRIGPLGTILQFGMLSSQDAARFSNASSGTNRLVAIYC